jgi:uncharacterized protein (TIGR00266 family)
MQIQLKHQPSYSLAIARLDPNEEVRVESGAMVSYSDGVTVETKSEGGLFGGLKRMVGGESFFQNIYKAPAQGGEITLAPALPGDMMVVPIRSGETFYLQSGAFIASEKGVNVETGWGGAKGFFGGAGLLLLRVTGEGEVLAGCYGAIEERVLAAGQRYNIDTGHIVGFDGTVQFNIKSIGGWKSTLLSGEGLVCELTGPGRVYMQTRSEEAFIGYMAAKMPRPSSSG